MNPILYILMRTDMTSLNAGKAMAQASHATNAFIQESDGLSRSYEGTGLGLAITSGLVSLLDASISVESEKGVGSTFIVNLPVAEQIGHGRHRLMGMRPGVRS